MEHIPIKVDPRKPLLILKCSNEKHKCCPKKV